MSLSEVRRILRVVSPWPPLATFDQPSWLQEGRVLGVRFVPGGFRGDLTRLLAC